MYAAGLGVTNPPVKTGAASPSPAAAVAGGFALHYDWLLSALPSPGGFFYKGNRVPLPGQPTPLFVGLTPGFVGLYQVNFWVPYSPFIPCGGNSAGNVDPFPNITSNLTVTLVGTTSFDGAGICVAAGVIPVPIASLAPPIL